ncbi:MAG TPA: alpha/beta hydrolase [Rhizomicrobium sp.]
MTLKNIAIGSLIALSLLAPSWVRAEDRPSTALYSDSRLVVRDRFSDEIVGQGPDLVLIPGLASSRATWKGTADRLKAHYRLHLIQLAGFAGEAPRANGSGEVVVPTAEALDAYLVEQHLAPAVVVGHSLGGTMALYLAEHHGDHLKKVLLVDALPFFAVIMGGPAATAAGMKPMADQIRASTASSMPGAQIAARMVSAPDDRAMVAGWADSSDPGTVNRAFADDLVLDMRAGLASIRVPVTLLYPDSKQPAGTVDGLYADAFAPVPHKTLVRIDNSLHFIMLDQPDRFAAALDAFLKG